MKEKKLRTYIESISRIKKDFWVSLQEESTISLLNKGNQYAKMGEQVKSIGFLISGVIRIYYLDDNGNEWNKAFLESPVFLLSNIDYNEKSQAYFEAVTKCEILKTPISFFIESLNKYPNLQKVYNPNGFKLKLKIDNRQLVQWKYLRIN